MRRTALLGLTILLPGLLAGCQYAGSPLDGFTGFVADTHGFTANPNAPAAQSETEKRVRGDEVAAAPLLPEPGEVWPGPPAPIPTLADVQKLSGNPLIPPPNLTPPPPSTVLDNTAPKAQ